MPICPEFAVFENEPNGKEHAFIQKFLIPLLSRMGFSVVNYHGKREFGRDLIFGEIDQFGHVRYCGLQAKFEPSISLGAMTAEGSLIADCKQAFATEFTHPHTGVIAKISSFYAVNAGSISNEAQEIFFSKLNDEFHHNVRLIDGKGLLALDRTASIVYGAERRNILFGLFNELRFNFNMLKSLSLQLKDMVAVNGTLNQQPRTRLRLAALEAFFARPLPELSPSLIDMDNLWDYCSTVNCKLDEMGHPLCSDPVKRSRCHDALVRFEFIEDLMHKIQGAIDVAVKNLGPFTAV